MFPLYRFKLNGLQVTPKYNSGLALEYTQEPNQKFYRTNLSGSLTFTESDYDAIMSQPFDFEHVLTIETIHNKAWTPVWTGTFYITDCTVNIEDKKIEVKPTVKDEYVDIINGLDKEFNLVGLKPAIENVNLSARSLLQIYQPGETVLSCFLGNLFWEQDCEAINNISDLTGLYGFEKMLDYEYLEVSPVLPPVAYPDITGRYVLTSQVATERVYTRDDGLYKIRRNTLASLAYKVYTSDDEYIAQAIYDSPSSEYPEFPWYFKLIETGQIIASLDYPAEKVQVYSRVLSNLDTDGTRIELTAEDMCGYNRNYKYAYKQKPSGDVAVIKNFSTEPTEWGIRQPGQYYVRPDAVGNYPYYPISRTRWDSRSFWYRASEADILNTAYDKPRTIRDAYTLGAAIKALLAEIAPNLTHEETAEYSQFLYGDKMANIQKLMICQKTNLINGEYQQPAQKATIKFSDITDLLAKAFKCYWYIEDNKFKIEHIRFFDNGGSYNSSAKIDTSLLLLTSKKNTKAWGFKASTYKFDKVNMPESYTFTWMDDTTVPFESSGLKILSNYVEKSKAEEITVSAFTTDVDYMLLNPSAISNDGFTLFGVDDTNTVLMVDTVIENVRYILQNGYLAFASLLASYYLYDLPAKRCKINGNEYEALSVAKNKKQEDIKFPISAAEWPNVFGLYQTNVGLGQIEKATVNLDTKIVNATLKYPTE